MTDKPILFSGPMVRAQWDERKSQTRRVLKPQPENMPTGVIVDKTRITQSAPVAMFRNQHTGIRQDVKLPFAIGDRLWVREAWRSSRHYDDLAPSEMGGEEPIQYMADGAVHAYSGHIDDLGGRTRASMHMPRWASRLTLIVTDVRVQRVQEISWSDSAAEGVDVYSERFSDLWNSLNGPDAWDANPWVSATTFEVHKCNIDQMEAA